MEFCNTVSGIITQNGLINHADEARSFFRVNPIMVNGKPAVHPGQCLRPGDFILVFVGQESHFFTAEWR